MAQWSAALVTTIFLCPNLADAQGSRYTPQDLTYDQIQRSIDRGVVALYQLEPTYTFPDEHGLYLIFRGTKNAAHQQAVHLVGNHAVACWALLACGESYQNPKLSRRLNWVLSLDRPYTYDRGMRAQMLAELPYGRWGPWVRRDALWLNRAITDRGGFGESWAGGQSIGWGDHANSQYGALGLWACQQAGYPIKNAEAIAILIDQQWRKTQQTTDANEPAGWAIVPFNIDQIAGTNIQPNTSFETTISGPMTAGGVSSLSATERYLSWRGSGDYDLSPQLRKGLAWLNQNFSLDDEMAKADWFFYMWTIQRVAQATGYRTFNGIDWFRQVTTQMLNMQKEDGSWSGPKGTLVSTGLTLIYLANSRNPLAISKLRLPEGDWNNRPHDLWNFSDYISDQYEVVTTWQIVDLDLSVNDLIESPMLYVTTDKGFQLSDKQIERLRDYINAGGMLVANPDGNRNEAVAAFNRLADKLFPDRKLKLVDSSHELYELHEKLGPSMRIRAIDNGIRPLMILFVNDIGQGLQANDMEKVGSFVALSNIYLYATGMNPRRVRLRSNFVVVKDTANTPNPIKVVRIKHGGTYDPEPNAISQLQAILANEHGVDTMVSAVAPAQLADAKMAFLTTLGDATIDEQSASELRRWIEGGGTLWIDAAGGGTPAAQNAYRIIAQIMPNRTLVRIDDESPIITGQGINGGMDNRVVEYRRYALRKMGPTSMARLQAIEVNGRPGIIYSSEDLTAGLAGLNHWGIFGYTPQSARDLVVNGVLSLLSQ